jgi:site-specific recombinase XerD
MPKKNLPPYVQVLWADREKKRPRGYRGWWQVEGRRCFGPTRPDAMAAHADAMRGRQLGRDLPPVGGTIGTLSDEWLQAIATRLAPDTLDYYRSRLSNVFRTIPKTVPIERVTPAILREFVREATDKHRLSGRTVQHCRRALNTFFGWLRRRGIVKENPVPLIDWPRAENTEPEALNEVELVSCLQRITDPWAAALAMFIAYTGLRRAEVARLTVDAVDIASGVLWVRGKARSQSHPLPADAIDAARVLVAKAGAEFVIPGSTDKARRGRIAETFRHWQRELKEPRWHPHTLRHSVATIMLRKGVSPAIVQRFLRHASYAMTQRYVHMVEDDLRGATAKLRLLGGDDRKAEHG